MNQEMQQGSLSLKEYTIQRINEDRRALLRELADSDYTYCFFASMYEIRAALDPTYSMPRVHRVVAEWQTLGLLENDGKVKASKTGILDSLQIVGNHLGLQIVRIYSHPAFLNQLIRQDEPDFVSSDAKDIWNTHAESYDYSGLADKRMHYLYEHGWDDYMLIEFSLAENGLVNNEDLEQRIIPAMGVKSPSPVHMRILAKLHPNA